MPDMNDFYAFTSTAGDGASGNGIGCSVPVLAIAMLLCLLYLIGRMSG